MNNIQIKLGELFAAWNSCPSVCILVILKKSGGDGMTCRLTVNVIQLFFFPLSSPYKERCRMEQRKVRSKVVCFLQKLLLELEGRFMVGLATSQPTEQSSLKEQGRNYQIEATIEGTLQRSQQ